jgi:hypothetical protein
VALTFVGGSNETEYVGAWIACRSGKRASVRSSVTSTTSTSCRRCYGRRNRIDVTSILS